MYPKKKNLLLRRSVKSSEHSTHASNETETDNSPRVRGHQTIRPAVHVQSPSGNTDNPNTKTSVHERFVQVAAFISRHAAILTSFPVEDKVCRHNSSTNNSCTVQKPLSHVALDRAGRRLHVGALKGIMKCLARLCEDGRDGLGQRPGGRVVDESSGVCGFRNLAQRRWYGKWASHKKRHDCSIDKYQPCLVGDAELQERPRSI